MKEALEREIEESKKMISISSKDKEEIIQQFQDKLLLQREQIVKLEMEIERYNRDMKRASQVNFTDPSQQNLIAVLANLLQTQVPQNMTQFNSNHRGSMYPEDQMMSMMGGPKP